MSLFPEIGRTDSKLRDITWQVQLPRSANSQRLHTSSPAALRRIINLLSRTIQSQDGSLTVAFVALPVESTSIHWMWRHILWTGMCTFPHWTLELSQSSGIIVVGDCWFHSLFMEVQLLLISLLGKPETQTRTRLQVTVKMTQNGMTPVAISWATPLPNQGSRQLHVCYKLTEISTYRYIQIYIYIYIYVSICIILILYSYDAHI